MKSITTLFAAIALVASFSTQAQEKTVFPAAHTVNEIEAAVTTGKVSQPDPDGAVIIIATPLTAPNVFQQQPQRWLTIGGDLRHFLGEGARQHIVNEQSYLPAKISAECQATFDRNWTALKESATYKLRPNLRKNLADVNFEVVDFDLHHIQGLTTYGDKTVRYSADLCKTPEYYMRGVMAHELGHIDSFYGDENIIKLIKGDSRYESIVFVNHVEWMENAANRWGASIERDAHFDSDKFLAVLDAVCRKGGQEFCQDAAQWREGLIE